MLELKALVACAPNFSGAKAYDRAAIIYTRAGELAAQLSRSNQAPQLLREAFGNYRLSDDRQGMNATWKRLKELGEDVERFDPVAPVANPVALGQIGARTLDSYRCGRPVLPQLAMSQAKNWPMA
jgi:hypothetical protein